jgi:hypothetical protein
MLPVPRDTMRELVLASSCSAGAGVLGGKGGGVTLSGEGGGELVGMESVWWAVSVVLKREAGLIAGDRFTCFTGTKILALLVQKHLIEGTESGAAGLIAVRPVYLLY